MPQPHKQSWTPVSKISFRVSILHCSVGGGEGGGGGELQENFEQDALFDKGTQKHKILRFLSRIVAF